MATHNVTITAAYIFKARRLRMDKIHTWECNANLPAGGNLKIDPERRTYTINNESIRADVTDAFPFFSPGAAKLIYNDLDVSRNITVRVLWRGGWV